MSGRSGLEALSLPYGVLERTIARLNATDTEAIRTRFRKLRLRPFPRDIRTGTGVRVRYDLARSIALATVFELNSLWLPQGSAVAVVERAWPEICRAAVCAASELGLLRRPRAAPSSAGSIVTFMPDGFASGAVAEVVAARVGGSTEPAGFGLRLDMARQVSALVSAADSSDPETAFVDLEARFGWTHPRDLAAPDQPGGDFLHDGPYFERAEALLGMAHGSGAAVVVEPPARVQALVDYLADPAPVDAWKAMLGTRADQPRLGHLLMAFARMRGFEAPAYDLVEAAVGPDELGALAADIIRKACSRRS
ncbi:hypothetical protein [Sphingomonas melonis]|uniref:Uncharacterized protein n=1 Tax=Sphingomonas melonis TaxID=152682 RepID=A0A7Y9K0T1_9SPHN|nr:hypothetical protein [Sphingomonas melonis]NYD89211.1 hypothetical protein [Sphingomonas melonis]